IPDPAMAARQAQEDLAGGADALCLVFAGAPQARGFGLDVRDAAALDAALAGVRLDLIRLRIEPASTGRAHAALVAALAERRGHDPARLDIHFGLDPVGMFAQTGEMTAAR